MEKAEAGAVTGMGHSQGKAQSPAREKRDLRHKERGGAIGWAVILHTHTQASHTAEEKELKGTGNTGRGETGRLGSEDLLPAICLRVTDTLLLGLKSSVSSSTVGWESRSISQPYVCVCGGAGACHAGCGQRLAFRSCFSPTIYVLKLNSGHRLANSTFTC